MTSARSEIDRGERFAFGENWARFLGQLDEARIRAAEQSLLALLGISTLQGRTFLDAGSGSGLFSLAARRLGAAVTSFDFDPASVACTAELKRRFYADDPHWQVLEGSVLDVGFSASLGEFDIVYSWGVLHHTGNMNLALDHAAKAVKPGGLLYIALYNDQGLLSRYWTWIKRLYNRYPKLQCALIALHSPLPAARFIVRRLQGRGELERGMSLWHDLIDWLGGYPFEVATVDAIFNRFKSSGLSLEGLKTCGGRMGCNEFVFKKLPTATGPTTQAA